MYRILCESYKNYENLIDKNSYRYRITEPIKLMLDEKRYKEEEKKKTENYKKLSDLLFYMSQNITKYPKFKALLWTLYSRNIKVKRFNISNEEELVEQAKLINSFLKLAYWNE